VGGGDDPGEYLAPMPFTMRSISWPGDSLIAWPGPPPTPPPSERATTNVGTSSRTLHDAVDGECARRAVRSAVPLLAGRGPGPRAPRVPAPFPAFPTFLIPTGQAALLHGLAPAQAGDEVAFVGLKSKGGGFETVDRSWWDHTPMHPHCPVGDTPDPPPLVTNRQRPRPVFRGRRCAARRSRDPHPKADP